MKKAVKIALFSFLAVSLCAGGIGTMNTDAVAEAYSIGNSYNEDAGKSEIDWEGTNTETPDDGENPGGGSIGGGVNEDGSIGDPGDEDAGRDDLDWGKEDGFFMQKGASLRVPLKDVEESEDKDGLRFRAYLERSYVEEKRELGELSVGMFIMPVNYLSTPINYENCFGENAVYYWAGNIPDDKTGKRQIVHVESYAYLPTAGSEYYQMDASIWNLKTANLDKRFIAVAYLKAGSEYFFAYLESQKGASPVVVAQKALLNPEDTIYNIPNDPDASTRVNEQYIVRYLGEGKEISYTYSPSKEKRSGTFATITSEQRSTFVTSYDTFVEAEEMTGFSFDDTQGVSSGYVLLDGSFVLNPAYKRNTYTVTFDGNGGTLVSGEEVQSVKYELPAQEPVYSYPGYTFNGWSTDFDSVRKDITVSANWVISTDAPYTVNYYLQNLDNDNYYLADSVTCTGTTFETVTAEIKNFNHFTYSVNASNISGVVQPDGSLTLGVYYLRKVYTVTFDGNGGTLVSGNVSQTVRYGGSVVAPAFEYEGYTFNGWSQSLDNISGNVTIYAGWKSNVMGVEFDGNGGSGFMNAIELTNGQTITLPLATFVYPGYIFEGWATSRGGDVVYADGAKFTMGTSGQILYAVWRENTTPPTLELPQSVIAWVDNGIVTLPTPTVIGDARHTLTVVVKDENDAIVTVTNGTIDGVTGTYTVTYTATTSSGETSTVQTKLIVRDSGVINDFESDSEHTLYNSGYVRTSAGVMHVHYTHGTALSLTYVDGFTLNDWSTFTAFEADVVNKSGSPLDVKAYFLVDGVWMETASTILATKASGAIKVFLADYGVSYVDGIRLDFVCAEGIDATVDNVRLTDATDDREIPTAGELSGLGGGVYEINAFGAKEIALGVTNSQGVVKYRIYAPVAFEGKVGLHYAGGSVYANKAFVAGWNEFVRYPNGESDASLVTTKLNSISIHNFNGYNVTVYLEGVTFETLSSIDLSSYAVTDGSYRVVYGESFEIPSPFTANNAWYSGLTVSLYKNTTLQKSGLSIGSVLTTGTGGLSSATYTIRYSFTDITGTAQQIEYKLVVESNYLTLSVDVPTLFADNCTLPEATVTSASFGSAVLAKVAKTISYREKGRTDWTLLEGEFNPKANRTYEIRYTAEYGNYYREVIVERYIHANDYTLDFEPDETAGSNAFKGGVKVPSRFLYDGGYWNYSADGVIGEEPTYDAGFNKEKYEFLATIKVGGTYENTYYYFKIVKPDADEVENGLAIFEMENGALKEVHPVKYATSVEKATKFTQETVTSANFNVWESWYRPTYDRFEDKFEYIGSLYYDGAKYAQTYYLFEMKETCYKMYNGVLTKVGSTNEAGDIFIFKANETKKSDGTSTYALTMICTNNSVSQPGDYMVNHEWQKFDSLALEYINRVTSRQQNRWEVSSDWASSGSTSIMVNNSHARSDSGFLIRPVMTKRDDFNAVSFWMKANGDQSNMIVKVGVNLPASGGAEAGAWLECEPIDVKAGVHYYTAYLKDTSVDFDCISGIKMNARPGAIYYIDDVSFTNVERLIINDSNEYADSFEKGVSYEIVKPTLSSDVLTDEQLKDAKFKLTYTVNNGAPQLLTPDANGKYILSGVVGEVVFTWSVSVDNIWNEMKVYYTESASSRKVNMGTAKLTVEHPEVIEQDSGVLLSAPTSSQGTLSNITVSYRPLGDTDGAWTALNKLGSGYEIDHLGVGYYELRYTADVTVGSNTYEGVSFSEIYIQRANVIVSFEGSDPFNGGAPYFASSGGGTTPMYEIVVVNETTGDMGMKILQMMQSWEGVHFATALQLGGSFNAFYIRVYSSANYNGYRIQYRTNSTSGWPEASVNLVQGWNDVIINVSTYTSVRDIIFKIANDGTLPTLTIDYIQAINYSIEGTMPTETYAGVGATLPTATAFGVSATISYRLKNTAEWTTLSGTTFAPSVAGTYEVRYSFDNYMDNLYSIRVKDLPDEIANFTESVTVNTSVVAPTATIGSNTVRSYYRKRGATSWTEFTNSSFTASSEFGYNLKFSYDSLGKSLEKNLAVRAQGEYLLTDFEKPFDRSWTTTYYWMDSAYFAYNDYERLRDTSSRLDLCSITTYNGNNVLQMSTARTAWDGPYWMKPCITFDFYTNTFRFKIRTTNQTKFESNFALWLLYNKSYLDNTTKAEVQLTVDFSNEVSLGDNWYAYTATIPSGTTNNVRCFEFRTHRYNLDAYYIDDVCAVNPNA